MTENNAAHAVEVCPECDIAGCKHIRERSKLRADGVQAGDERDTGKDRLAFHIWALVRGMDITLNDSCGYQSPLTQRAWMRWNTTESPTPSVVKQSLTATQTGEKGEGE